MQTEFWGQIKMYYERDKKRINWFSEKNEKACDALLEGWRYKI